MWFCYCQSSPFSQGSHGSGSRGHIPFHERSIWPNWICKYLHTIIYIYFLLWFKLSLCRCIHKPVNIFLLLDLSKKKRSLRIVRWDGIVFTRRCRLNAFSMKWTRKFDQLRHYFEVQVCG